MNQPRLSFAHQQAIDTIETFGAHNYRPLPVVIESGDGSWLTDVDGHRYLDFLSAYSAVNFGHSNPALVSVAIAQVQRLAITSRAVYSANLAPFLTALCRLTGKEMALPMNTGVEAVETSLKLARKWGYRVKGVQEDRANIVVMTGNFHGRTISVVSFSDDPNARSDFGPFTPGFRPPFRGSGRPRSSRRRQHRGHLGRTDSGRGRSHPAAGGLPCRRPRGS